MQVSSSWEQSAMERREHLLLQLSSSMKPLISPASGFLAPGICVTRREHCTCSLGIYTSSHLLLFYVIMQFFVHEASFSTKNKFSEVKGLPWVSLLTPKACWIMPGRVDTQNEQMYSRDWNSHIQTDSLPMVEMFCCERLTTKQMFLYAAPVLSVILLVIQRRKATKVSQHLSTQEKQRKSPDTKKWITCSPIWGS